MKKKWIILAVWIAAILILKQNDLFTFDLNTLQAYISGNANYVMLLFLVLWVVRLVVFLPGATLMVLGGICFEPIVGFLLSMVGLFLSETLVYIFSKTLSTGKINRALETKYPDMKMLLEKYQYKFLALGMICPIAPTDVICFLSASIGMKYSLYIGTILISNIPFTALYSFIGISLNDSVIGIIFIMITILLFAAISVKIWRDLKQKYNQVVEE